MLHGSEKRRGLDARWIGRTNGSALVAGLWGREKRSFALRSDPPLATLAWSGGGCVTFKVHVMKKFDSPLPVGNTAPTGDDVLAD